jgi:malate dehydrogenase
MTLLYYRRQDVRRSKITIVGAGNVGATAAHIALARGLGDIVLLDIVEDLAEGKALDLAQSGPLARFDCTVVGTRDWQRTADSDVVIITSGLARKPGMSRDDLLMKNCTIVKSVSEQTVRFSPDCFIIVVSNPLDAMVYTAAKVSGFARNRVMGMAGALDTSRFSYFIAAELGISSADVQTVLLGGHGDDMVPLPRFTTVGGIPLTQLMPSERIDALIERTRNAGIEVVNLLGRGAYYAPAAGVVQMAEAILRDTKALICCSAYCDSEYSVGGYFVGLPVVLGAGGVERIIELELSPQEKQAFDISLSHIRKLAAEVDEILG